MSPNEKTAPQEPKGPIAPAQTTNLDDVAREFAEMIRPPNLSFIAAAELLLENLDDPDKVLEFLDQIGRGLP